MGIRSQTRWALGAAVATALTTASATSSAQVTSDAPPAQPPDGAAAPAGQAAPTSTQPAPPPKRRGEPRYENQWYGWEILLADAVDASLFVGAAASESSTVLGIGYGAFLLGPPIVHFTHGNVGVGFGDFGLRLFVPWITGGIGALVGLIVGVNNAVNDAQGTNASNVAQKSNTILTDTSSGPKTGLAVGLFIGWAVCVGIDAGLLAHERVRVDADDEFTKLDLKKPPQLTWQPILSAAPHGGFAGVGGTF